MAYRFYCPDVEEGKVTKLESEQVRHLKVLAISKSESINLFDGKGKEFTAEILDLKTGEIKIKKQVQAALEPKVRVTIASAVPKLTRFNILVEKVSELGALNIVPILCERCVVKPKKGKIQRAQRIAIEASAQSKRATLTTIENVVELEQLLARAKEHALCMICTPAPEAKPLHEVYKDEKNVLVLIGPEGGFTEEERKKALNAGFKPVSLGPTTLRIETAAITAIAQIRALNP
jgi:16S rRNA (uracil1498-N3)-methyltransferase